MSLHIDGMPDVCPICGEELTLKDAVFADDDTSGAPGMVSCPSCHFKMKIPNGSTEEVEGAMKREREKKPQDYEVFEKHDTPGEDPMQDYYQEH